MYFVKVTQSAPLNTVETREQAIDYLNKYGYNTCANLTDVACSVDLSSLLTKFQTYYGLDETGELDTATRQLMNRPRCGNPDSIRDPESLTLSKWSKKSLTWSLRGHPDQFSFSKTESIMEWAFLQWTDHIPIKMNKTCSHCNADIVIDFVQGQHEDTSRFDGPGGILAHAFLPEDGRIHFDKDEEWNDQFSNSNSLYLVAVHEIGHVLGIGHHSSKNSIMYAASLSFTSNEILSSVDRDVVQSIYGHQFPSVLKKGQRLNMNDRLRSPYGKYSLVMQSDGNLVLYKHYQLSTQRPIWASQTMGQGTSPYHAILQENGNFVLYDGNNTEIWSSHTAVNDLSTFLIMQDDGNLVLYKNLKKPIPLWSTGTHQPSDVSCEIMQNSSYIRSCSNCSTSSNGCSYTCECAMPNGTMFSTSIRLEPGPDNNCHLSNDNGRLVCNKEKSSTTTTRTSESTTTTTTPESTMTTTTLESTTATKTRTSGTLTTPIHTNTSSCHYIKSFKNVFPNEAILVYKYKSGGFGRYYGEKLLGVRLYDGYYLDIFKLSSTVAANVTSDQIRNKTIALISETKLEKDNVKRRDVLYPKLKELFPNHNVNVFIFDNGNWLRCTCNQKGTAHFEKNYGSEVDIVLT